MGLHAITSILAAIAANVNDPPSVERIPATGERSHSHANAHDEIDEEHGPLLFEATYIGEAMANASGGLARGARYLDNLDLVFEADLEALAGWRGAELHVYGLYNNGGSISELAGDALAVSNIETGVSAFRLYEAWIDQQLGDSLSIKLGLYDLNSEFDSLEASGLFMGSAHGIGHDIGQTGLNGPSIFPYTSLAARLEKTFASGLKIRAALLDAVPGDPDNPARTVIRLNADEGALAVAEIDIPVADSSRLLIGHWRYTARFETFDQVTARGNDGFYVRGETDLFQNDNRRLQGFFRLGQADSRFNMFDVFASVGLKLTGVIADDGEDELGFAIAAARTSDGWREMNIGGKGETVFELTYRRDLFPFLALQPNVQYMLAPSADPTVGNALVFGLRAELVARQIFD